MDSQRVERDYELFLRELEEDEEMRGTVNLYRDSKKEEEKRMRKERAAQIKAEREAAAANGMVDEGDEDDGMRRMARASGAMMMRRGWAWMSCWMISRIWPSRIEPVCWFHSLFSASRAATHTVFQSSSHSRSRCAFEVSD